MTLLREMSSVGIHDDYSCINIFLNKCKYNIEVKSINIDSKYVRSTLSRFPSIRL